MEVGSQVRFDVHYSGRVQGVGFRYNARNIARCFSVSGWVRNLADGRVRLLAEGERSEVERFLAAVADSMAGYIDHVDSVAKAATGEFASFEISK